MPICQIIKFKHPLPNGFLPPAPLEWDGDLRPVYRGNHHLLALLGVFNELASNERFPFSEFGLCFGDENAPLNLSVNTAETQQFHPRNQPPFCKQRWLTRLIVSNSERQGFCRSDAALILSWNPSNIVKSTQNSSWTHQQTVITSGCLCVYVTHRVKSPSASCRFLSHTFSAASFPPDPQQQTIYLSFYFYH